MSKSPLFEELLGQITLGLNTLPDKPEETPESTLCALWHTAGQAPKSAEAACDATLPVLDDVGEIALRAMVVKRLSGVPLAHISGRQRFMGLEMLAGPGALIPRKETEILARGAVDVAAQVAKEQGALTVIDVCTGSGNIALSVAHNVPQARVFAADISDAAVELARRNARHLGLDARVQFSVGDLIAPFDNETFHNKVDVLTCNPPYINSAKVEHLPSEISAHEPVLAFDGGRFGVAILMRLLQDAPRLLRRGGWLISEVGLGQAPTLAKMIGKNPAFSAVHTLQDETGNERTIVARC